MVCIDRNGSYPTLFRACLFQHVHSLLTCVRTQESSGVKQRIELIGRDNTLIIELRADNRRID